MPRRTHLRWRVLLLTGAFAFALFTITFGLSWEARVSQQRWSRLMSVETQAIATLEEMIRQQNAFRVRLLVARARPDQYVVVAQLLDREALRSIDTTYLRGCVRAFENVIDDSHVRRQDVVVTSNAIVNEAQRLAASRKAEIARQLPALERDTREMMSSGLAIAWIIVIVSFALAQVTLRNVVRPLEELSQAADRIAAGDLYARAPVAGDLEVAKLGVAFNRMADELNARARTDDLTGLPNFRAFRERIDVEIARAARYPEQFGILVLDLDHFKKYNDRFGHLAGNDALQRVAEVIRETVRAVDFPARYGGEEFAVILPQIDGALIIPIAERIRAGVEALPATAEGATMTVSIGAAIFPFDGNGADALFHAADQRLYEAKRLGRNRVVAMSDAARTKAAG
jgi:diguanylate cyclase (GGDEF)-like protein